MHFILDALFILDLAVSLVMVGLDNAGKSTALYRYKNNQYCETIPTIGFNCEKIKGKLGKTKDVFFTIWDVGGQDRVRPLWRTYAKGAEGIIFVLDSADHDTLEEAKMELVQICKSADMNTLPILIIANKQDLPNALTLSELNYYFFKGGHEPALENCQLNKQQVKIVGACAITGDGLDEGLEILYDMIVNKKQHKSKSKR